MDLAAAFEHACMLQYVLSTHLCQQKSSELLPEGQEA